MNPINIDVMRVFFKDDYRIIANDSVINSSEVVFVVKIQNIKKRLILEQSKKNSIGGFLNNVTSNIVDKVSGYISDSYAVMLKNGSLRLIISNKDIPSCNLEKFNMTIKNEFRDGIFKIYVNVNNSFIELESFEINITNKNIEDVMIGSLSEVIAYFNNNPLLNNDFLHLKNTFYELSILKQMDCDKSNVFDFKCNKNISTLVSIYDDKIIMPNVGFTLELCDVVKYVKNEGHHVFLMCENNLFTAYVISTNPIKFDSEIINLAALPDDQQNVIFDIDYNLNNANEVLIAGVISDNDQKIDIVIVDYELYMGNEKLGMHRAKVFLYEGDIYVVFENGNHTVLRCSESINESVKKILISLNKELNFDEIQICVNAESREVNKLKIRETSFIINETEYQYDGIENYKLINEDYFSLMSFSSDNEYISIVTCKSIGFEVWKKVEDIQLMAKIKSMTLLDTYKFINELKLNKFLACTFGEIIKADRLLNKGKSIESVLRNITDSDKVVLRSTLQSIKGKFFVNEDLQETLLKKVSGIELERKIVTKLLDEWVLVYPHYYAQLETNWLRAVFGNFIQDELIERERWKLITNTRRVIQQAQMSLSKHLFEIQSCTAHISNAIPDEIKKVDTSRFRRLNSNNLTEQMVTGANIALGTTVALEALNVILRGIHITNPIIFTSATKMIIDSYAKDDMERRDIKNFGYQTLSWWDAMMSCMPVIIFEAREGFKTIIENSMIRDGEVLKKLTVEQKIQVQKRMANLLVNEAKQVTNEKFSNIIPEYDIYVADIMTDIDDIKKRYSVVTGWENFGKLI